MFALLNLRKILLLKISRIDDDAMKKLLLMAS